MNSTQKITDFKFQHSLRTRWIDLDAFRHINNAVYLSYIEDARLELLSRWEITQDGKSVIVASVTIDYYKQVLHPTELIIGQRVSRIGNKSFDITSIVFNKDTQESICQSVITIVCFDFSSNKTVLVYNEIKHDYGK
jgi:acyl-CoA thioester hydrolase